MPTLFNLAHLTDFHLFQVQGAPWRSFFNKRCLSYLSWRLHRGKVNSPHVLNRLSDGLSSLALDQVVVTGDLTHMGLDRECQWARQCLMRIGTPDRVFVVPGNHDAMVPSAREAYRDAWRDYMAADRDETGPEPSSGFVPRPAVRIRNGVALIGLSSACPTPPFSAAGRLGREQCRRLAAVLDRTGRQGHFRVVLVHHPILPGQVRPRKCLRDATTLRNILGRHGAELVLHGHTHRHSYASLPGPAASIPVVGLPASTARDANPEKSACLRTYAILTESGGWRIDVRDYRLSVRGRALAESPHPGLSGWRTCPNLNP